MLVDKAHMNELYYIADALESWLTDPGLPGVTPDDLPQVEVSFTMYCAAISIGDVTVWCSEADAAEDLTVNACQCRYLKHCQLVAHLYEVLSKTVQG
jgi:hypothetical protein